MSASQRQPAQYVTAAVIVAIVLALYLESAAALLAPEAAFGPAAVFFLLAGLHLIFDLLDCHHVDPSVTFGEPPHRAEVLLGFVYIARLFLLLGVAAVHDAGGGPAGLDATSAMSALMAAYFALEIVHQLVTARHTTPPVGPGDDRYPRAADQDAYSVVAETFFRLRARPVVNHAAKRRFYAAAAFVFAIAYMIAAIALEAIPALIVHGAVTLLYAFEWRLHVASKACAATARPEG